MYVVARKTVITSAASIHPSEGTASKNISDQQRIIYTSEVLFIRNLKSIVDALGKLRSCVDSEIALFLIKVIYDINPCEIITSLLDNHIECLTATFNRAYRSLFSHSRLIAHCVCSERCGCEQESCLQSASSCLLCSGSGEFLLRGRSAPSL